MKVLDHNAYFPRKCSDRVITISSNFFNPSSKLTATKYQNKTKMESSIGFMTVFAVSGSVVLLAAQFHKHLLSDYMEKLELQQPNKETKKKKKKKVSFAEDMVEPSGNNEDYRRKIRKSKSEDGGRRRSPTKESTFITSQHSTQ